MNIKHVGAATALAVAVAIGAAAGPAGRGPTVKVISLQVVRAMSAQEREIAMVGSEGTSLKLLVSAPGRSLMSMDWAQCKLTSFRDDKQTDLADRRPWGKRPGWIGPVSPRISKDRQMCVVEVRSPRGPAAGAKQIILTGRLALRSGSAVKTARQPAMKLVRGSVISAGPIALKVASVRTDGWGGAKMILTLSSAESTDVIEAITFVGPDGKAIPHSVLSTGRRGVGDKTTYEITYALDRKADAIGVKVAYYSKVETLIVPLDISIGVGL